MGSHSKAFYRQPRSDGAEWAEFVLRISEVKNPDLSPGKPWVVREGPDSKQVADRLYDQGVECWKQGDYAGAEEVYKEVQRPPSPLACMCFVYVFCMRFNGV